MAITNLTNTTWYVPSGWTAAAGYGQFNIAGSYIIDNNEYELDGSQLCFGYSFESPATELTAKENTIVSMLQLIDIGNSSAITLKIVEGDDTTNTSLIAWLQDNGTWQTDVLSGTWVFNERIELSDATTSTPTYDGDELSLCDVYFKTADGDYVGFYLSSANGTSWNQFGYKRSNGDPDLAYMGGWYNSEDRTITFDGLQTVSEEFYNWFTANATPQTEEEVYTPTEGLSYSLSSDGTYYTCTGIGTATDTDIVIASEIDGIPVTSIISSAFRDCTSLTSVTILGNITDIDEDTFRGCNSLEKVIIPASVITIWDGAFEDCTSLTNITFEGTIAQWQSIMIYSNWDSNTPDYTIYCTDGTISKDGTVTPNEPEEPSTTEYITITYDGKTIATITEGQTITLHTNGKKAKTDIVISVSDTVSKGHTITFDFVEDTSKTTVQSVVYLFINEVYGGDSDYVKYFSTVDASTTESITLEGVTSYYWDYVLRPTNPTFTPVTQDGTITIAIPTYD